MTVMIQIRNVPNDLHAKLKVRAAQAGMSLSDYLLNEIRRTAELPTMQEMRARLEQLEPVDTATDPVDIIREMRGPI